jgi:amino acid adenylation domain-containing protein
MTAIQSGEAINLWNLASIRVIVNGAEPISESITKQFVILLYKWGLKDDVIYPGYGLAEASVAVTLPDVGHQLSFVHCDRSHMQFGEQIKFSQEEDCLSFANCGYPVNDCEVRIADDKDQVLPELSIGNIQVAGANVTSGYYRQNERTDVFTKDSWLKTGDLGFLWQGNLIVTGRRKNIIIVNGQNYYPHDIEQLVERELNIRPGSVVACSLTLPDAQSEVAVFLLFKGDINTFFEQSQVIKEIVSSRIGIHLHHVLPVRTIPKTTSGKVMHYSLVEDYFKGVFDKDKAQLASLSQQLPADIFSLLKQLLGNNISLDANLFNAGLNSLKALTLINSLKQHGYHVTFSMLSEADTPAKLSKMLTGKSSTDQTIPKSPYDLVYPLSWGQKQIYVAHLLAPGSSNFNITFSVDIIGDLNENYLAEAFRLLVKRHEILRTTIVWQDNEPVQILSDDIKPVVVSAQLSDTRIQEIAHTPFKLEEGPLYRLYLTKKDNGRSKLVFSIHHIICDGWSIQIIGKELGIIYQSLKDGRKHNLPPALIQYKDFVYWHRRSETYEQDGNFWKQYLTAPLPQTNIPASIGRYGSSTGRSAAGAVVHKRYSRELTSEISTVAGFCNVTFFSVLVSALALVVKKYNYHDDEDLLFGTDTAGRTHWQLEDQIGFFLNVLPLRLKIDRQASFTNLLKETYNNLLSVYDHQNYPIDNIVGTSQGSGQFSIFSILVLFQNFDEALGFDGVFQDLKTHTEEIDNDTCLNDVLFEFSLTEGQLALKVKYSVELYDQAYITNLCEHLGRIMEQVSHAPETLIADVDILTVPEKEQVLHLFNNTSIDWQLEEMNLVSCFEHQAALTPDNTALISKGVSLSYQELNNRANQLAGWLITKHQVNKNELIGISTGRNENLIIGILGILKAGAAYVPVDPEYPADRIRYIVEDSRLRLLLTDQDINSLHDRKVYDNLKVPQSSDLAYVIYTSGSTGNPKGVMIQHRSAVNYVQAFAHYFNVNSSDRVIQQSAIAFDTMVEEIFPVLFKGGVLVMAEHGGRDVDALVDLMLNERISILSTTPLVLNELNYKLGNKTSLRLIVSGGDELQAAHIDNLIQHLPVYNTYGPTEATVCTTYFPVTDIRKSHLIGKPVANTQVYILDEWLHPQTVGVPGELCIAGEGVAAGYLNNPALTQERFLTNPYGKGNLYRTGDIVRWNGEGNIEFFGRRDNQVKILGFRIEPGEIEQCLLASGLVNQAVVTTVLIGTEKSLVAYYTSEVQPATIREYLQRKLPYYMVPAYIMPLERLPLTPNGKVDRKALPAPHLQPRTYRPAVTETEQTIARIWEEVLASERIGLDDNFFEIGGQSLKAIQVIYRIFKELSVKLELQDLFANPMLSQLAEKIEVLLWFNSPVTTDLASNTDEIII